MNFDRQTWLSTNKDRLLDSPEIGSERQGLVSLFHNGRRRQNKLRQNTKISAKQFGPNRDRDTFEPAVSLARFPKTQDSLVLQIENEATHLQL